MSQGGMGRGFLVVEPKALVPLPKMSHPSLPVGHGRGTWSAFLLFGLHYSGISGFCPAIVQCLWFEMWFSPLPVCSFDVYFMLVSC